MSQGVKTPQRTNSKIRSTIKQSSTNFIIKNISQVRIKNIVYFKVRLQTKHCLLQGRTFNQTLPTSRYHDSFFFILTFIGRESRLRSSSSSSLHQTAAAHPANRRHRLTLVSFTYFSSPLQLLRSPPSLSQTRLKSSAGSFIFRLFSLKSPISSFFNSVLFLSCCDSAARLAVCVVDVKQMLCRKRYDADRRCRSRVDIMVMVLYELGIVMVMVY
ncbi:hypothetical protein RYX36_026001 [Vicia faba]